MSDDELAALLYLATSHPDEFVRASCAARALELRDRPVTEAAVARAAKIDDRALAGDVAGWLTETEPLRYRSRHGRSRVANEPQASRLHVMAAQRSATTGAVGTIKAPKSRRVRSVPMVPLVAQALATLGQREHFTSDDELVFGNAVGAVENDALIRRRYRRALKTAGLPPVRFHDLRQAFGSTAVKAFPLSDVQAMLGHAHVSTTMRYVHHRPGKDDAARLAAALGGEAVPRAVPRNRGYEDNSEQLSDTETA